MPSAAKPGLIVVLDTHVCVTKKLLCLSPSIHMWRTVGQTHSECLQSEWNTIINYGNYS